MFFCVVGRGASPGPRGVTACPHSFRAEPGGGEERGEDLPVHAPQAAAHLVKLGPAGSCLGLPACPHDARGGSTGGRWGSTAPAFCGSKTSPLHPTACETARVSPKTGQIRQTHFIISQPLAWEGAGGKWGGDGGWPPLTPRPSPQAQPALLERRLLRRRALRAQEALPHHQVGPSPPPKKTPKDGERGGFPARFASFFPKGSPRGVRR